MQRRTGAIVASLAVAFVAVAALAPALGAAAGGEEPTTVQVNPLPLYLNIGISPKVLPVGAETPATLRLHAADPPYEDGSGWAGFSTMTIDLDKSIHLNAGAFPTCGRRLLEADLDLEERVPSQCEKAIVGRSQAKLFINPPEQIGLKDPASGVIYNGGARGGVTHLIVELPFESPGESAWVTVLIGKGATTGFPRFEEGFGALYEFSLELNRKGFVTAECTTGKITDLLAATFRDGTKAHEELIRACSP
jgi:hypothetical protein